MSIYNTTLVKDLFEKGCVNNKTFLIELPQLDDDLMRHFIRGYFDGDGNIFKSKDRKNTYKISIMSNFNFITKLKEYFFNELSIVAYIKPFKNKKNFMLFLYKREDIKRIRDFLYETTTIYLERKKKIFEELY